MLISKILVAHDFSDPSNRTLLFAGQLAQKLSASLDVVYVMSDVFDGRAELALELPVTSPGHGQRYLEFLDAELQRVVQAVLPSAPMTVKCHVLRGDPVKHIESLAQELGAGLICVGATGKGAVARVMLGSISQLLLRTSSIPVLTVP